MMHDGQKRPNKNQSKKNGKRNVIKMADYKYTTNSLSEFKTIGDDFVADYIFDSDNKFVVENLIKWLFNEEFVALDPDNTKKQKTGKMDKGVYIAGPCGTGKSLLLKILKEFSKRHPQKWKIGDKEVRPYWQTFHAAEIVNKFRNGADLGYINTIPIIGIDDVGAEPRPTQYMGNKVDVIKEILEVRGDKEVYTLITSNCDLDEIDEIYGDRVASRLKALNYYEINGDDKR